MASAGSAYVQIRGDLSHLNKQLVANLAPQRMKKFGLLAGAGLAAGFGGVAVGKGLFDLGQSFDDAFDKIRVATGKTGANLQGLKGDFNEVFKGVPGSMDNTAKAVGGLAARLNLSGKPLQRLSKQLLNLAHITGTDVQENVESSTRLFKDWAVPTNEQSVALDKLFRVFQKTGLTVDKNARLLVQFGSPLRQLGFDMDTAAAMFGRFEKEGVNLTTILPGFRFALKNLSTPTGEAAAQLKKLGAVGDQPAVALQKVFAAIKGAPDDLKANAIAFAIFGKRAGPDMAAAVREGRLELDELKRAMNTNSDTINKAARDTRDFSESWELLKKRLAVALQPAALKVFDTISKIVKVAGDPNLSGAQKWDRISDIIVPAFEKALQGASDAAVKFGPKIAAALFRGFLNAPPLLQILTGAFLFKKAGPLLASAGLLGRQTGAAFSTGMATTVATKGGGGAAGGAAAGGLAAFGAKLSRFAKVSVGVATGAAILEGIRLKLEKPDVGLEKRLKQLQAPGVLGTRKIIGGAQNLIGKVPGLPGPAKGDFGFQLDKSKELQKVLDQINSASGERVSVLQRQAAALANQLDLTQRQKTELSSLFKLKATGDVSRAIGGLGQASGAAKDALPGVLAAQKQVNELRKQGKTDTHAYAEAVRALDTAEATRATALRARTDQQNKAVAATKADLRAAQQTLANDRRLGASKSQLREDMAQVAQAASRQFAALTNVSRAIRGLTPITGAAGTKMGALLKQFQGLEGVGKFRKFLITADMSSVEKGIKLATKLQGLGRGKTVMKIFAESKSPEQALRKLQGLVDKLTEKRHKVEVLLRDLATRGLHNIRDMIQHLPRGKISVDVVAGKISLANKLDRIVAESLQRAGLGQAAKQVRRAGGGIVGSNEAVTLVGEQGPELARLPGVKHVLVGQEGPEVRELPAGTRVFSHPETKRKLAPIVQKVSRVLAPTRTDESVPSLGGVDERRITMRLEDEATGRVERLRGLIDKLPTRKKFTLDAGVNLTPGLADLLRRAGRGPLGKPLRLAERARGGIVRERLTIVGEEGPELVTLPVGSRVHPHAQSMRMMKRMQGSDDEPASQKTIVRKPQSMRKLIERVWKLASKTYLKDQQPQLIPTEKRVEVAKPNAIVGEQGPELVTLPVGSQVFSHPESVKLAQKMEVPGFARGGRIRDPDYLRSTARKRRRERTPSRRESRRGDRIAQQQERARNVPATPRFFKPRAETPEFEHHEPSPAEKRRGDRIAARQEKRRAKRRQVRRRDRREDELRLRMGLGGISPFQRKHGMSEHEAAARSERPKKGKFFGLIPEGSPLGAAIETLSIAGGLGTVKTGTKALAQNLQTLSKNPRYKRLLSREQKDAIDKYVSGVHQGEMNASLRRGAKFFDEKLIGKKGSKAGWIFDSDTAKQLDTAFVKKLPAKAPPLYRGVRPGGRGAEQFDTLKDGDVFTDLGFGSTSYKPGPARGFGTTAFGRDDKIRRYKIKSKGGTRYIGIGGREHEVLLPRGMKYKVVGRRKIKGGEQLELEMLDAGSGRRRKPQKLAKGGLSLRPPDAIKGWQPKIEVGARASGGGGLVSSAWRGLKPHLPKIKRVQRKPTVHITDQQRGEYPDGYPRGGYGQISMPRWSLAALKGGPDVPKEVNDWAKSTIVHEFVHGVQSLDTLKDRAPTEGGAVLFGEKFQGGINGSTWRASGQYRSWANQMQKERGDKWVMKGQFAPDPDPKPKPKAKDSKKKPRQKLAKGGLVRALYPRFIDEDLLDLPGKAFQRIAKAVSKRRGSQLSLVGEQGPELAQLLGASTVLGRKGPEVLELPIGTRVHPAPKTRQMLKVPGTRMGEGSAVIGGSGREGTGQAPLKLPRPVRSAFHEGPLGFVGDASRALPSLIVHDGDRAVSPRVGSQPLRKTMGYPHPTLADTQLVSHAATLLPSQRAIRRVALSDALGRDVETQGTDARWGRLIPDRRRQEPFAIPPQGEESHAATLPTKLLGTKQADRRSLASSAVDHVFGARGVIEPKGKHSLGAKVKHLLIPDRTRSATVPTPLGGDRLDRDVHVSRAVSGDQISPLRPTFDQPELASLGLSLQGHRDGAHVLSPPAARDENRPHMGKAIAARLGIQKVPQMVARVLAPGTRQDRGSQGPILSRGSDGLAMAQMVGLPAIPRDSYPMAQGIRSFPGAPAFVRGGTVKKEDRDPTAKKGQPDREVRKSRSGKVPYEAKASGVSSGIATRANKLDRLKLPYVYGGGHGNIGQALKSGFDCSGAVSYALGIPARVSGAFSNWGKEGPGEVSTYSNPAHMVMSIGNRLFGTGDGTGPHWLAGGPDARFSSSFKTRHIGKSGERGSFGAPGKGAKGEKGEKTTPRRITGGKLSLGQMYTLAKSVKFPDPALAAAIGFAESKGQVRAVGDGGDSVGLWQINLPSHKQYKRDDMFDAKKNARAALSISKHGKDFDPWSVYSKPPFPYKEYLGKTKGAPLPKGTKKAVTGDSKLDYMAAQLLDAEGLTPADPKDDIRWINRMLRYWRGVYRRNKKAGNSKRQGDARSEITSLAAKKKELRTVEEDPDLLKLGDLTKIGTGPNAFNLEGMGRVIDAIDLEKANASLTLPAVGDDSIGALAASLQDDITAQDKLVNFWSGIKTATDGFMVPPTGPGHWQGTGPTAKWIPDKPSVFKPTKEQSRQLDKTKNQRQRIALLNRFQDEAEPKGTWIQGTMKQKIEATEKFGTALDELRNLKAEISKTTDDEPPEATPDTKSQDLKAFFGSIADLLKEHGRNFTPLQSFATGGIIQGPKGKAVTIEGHGGEAVVNEDGDLTVTIKPEQLKELAQQGQGTKTVIFNTEYKHSPVDPHTDAKNREREIRNLV